MENEIIGEYPALSDADIEKIKIRSSAIDKEISVNFTSEPIVTKASVIHNKKLMNCSCCGHSLLRPDIVLGFCRNCKSIFEGV